MAREITAVIDQIVVRLETIPGYKYGTPGTVYDYKTLKELVDCLRRVKRSCDFTAPEAMLMRWEQLCNIMEDALPDMTLELAEELKGIIRG